MPSCCQSLLSCVRNFCAVALLGLFTLDVTASSSPVAEPVIKANFPDPCLAQSKSGTWYAFSTHNENINVQVASSEDFNTWTLHRGYDALPKLPSWALPHPRSDGRYF